MYILIKIICYLCIYIIPKRILKKRLSLKELIVFLILGLYTFPIMRITVMDNPEFLDAINGYMDMIIAVLVIL